MPRLTAANVANKLIRSKTTKGETRRGSGPVGAVTLQGKWRGGNAFVSIGRGGIINGRLGTPGLTIPGDETVETRVAQMLKTIEPLEAVSTQAVEVSTMPVLFSAMDKTDDRTRVSYVSFRVRGALKSTVRTLEDAYEAVSVRDPWTRVTLCAPGVAACTSTPREYGTKTREKEPKSTLPGFDTMSFRPKKNTDPSFTLTKKGTITIHNAKSTRDALQKRKWIAARLPPLAAYARV